MRGPCSRRSAAASPGCRRRVSSRRKSASMPVSLPASIAEMSSTSSTSASSDLRRGLDHLARIRAVRHRAGSSTSSSDMPTMPFSGVRNSWLMLARKRLFASLARRASSVARVNARSSEAQVRRNRDEADQQAPGQRLIVLPVRRCPRMTSANETAGQRDRRDQVARAIAQAVADRRPTDRRRRAARALRHAGSSSPPSVE